MIRFLGRLRRDAAGGAVIEFGILAPAIVTLFLGILQVGMWMQSYNALRSVAADAGRYTAVQYQKANYISNIAMATWARNRAVDHYLFKTTDVSADVTDAADQRITGVTEKTLTVTYKFKSVMSIVGLEDQNVSYARPIFVKTT